MKKLSTLAKSYLLLIMPIIGICILISNLEGIAGIRVLYPLTWPFSQYLGGYYTS